MTISHFKNKIIHGDCLEVMKQLPDKSIDLVLTDPPYGIGADKGVGRSLKKNSNIIKKDDWDKEIPSEEIFNQIFRISRNQIIWGGNYFINDLKDTKCFIVLDKSNIPDNFKTMSPVELAWTSFSKPSKIFRTSTNTGNKIHPTQKPIVLYEWLLINYAKEGDKILDTHLGSGSIAIACHNLGYDLDAYEIDKEYYEATMKRFNNHTAQLRLI